MWREALGGHSVKFESNALKICLKHLSYLMKKRPRNETGRFNVAVTVRAITKAMPSGRTSSLEAIELKMGSSMFFLLRTAFWLTLVLVLIPLGSTTDESETGKVDPVAAYSAASAAVSDFGGFCGRNPQACETGGDAIAMIGARARDGARIVYEFLDTQITEQDAGGQPQNEPHRPLITGAISNGTLTAQDLAQPWQGHNKSVSAKEIEIGPVPRPNPRSGSRT